MATPSSTSALAPTSSVSLPSTITSAASSIFSSATEAAPTSTSSVIEGSAGSAQQTQGISLNKFVGALVVAIIIFAVQLGIFLLLRNRLARIL